MTPLYDVLRQYAAEKPARFHMPGHKGGKLPVSELTAAVGLDVTEIPGTGNLYCAGEPFDSAQALWAEKFGFEFCQFLTGGSTMGLHTGLSLLCSPGDKILVDRNCHRAVFHAMALLDLEPVYLERPWLGEENLIGPIAPEQVEKQLSLHPEVKTVCITSPTYTGILSDVAEISHIVHVHGGKLLVDGAHGAHLPFLGEMASVFGTSSPSYLVLASMDAARDWLEGEGGEEYRRTALRVAELRRKFPALGSGLSLDPTRLTLNVRDGSGFARALEAEGIFPEMEDGGHVVLICAPWDLRENLDRLERALEKLLGQMGPCAPIPAPPLPERVCSLREALFARTEVLPLERCAGRTAAAQLAPYPPGVPVVAPGERITEKELAYFVKIGYNNTDVPVIAR